MVSILNGFYNQYFAHAHLKIFISNNHSCVWSYSMSTNLYRLSLQYTDFTILYD